MEFNYKTIYFFFLSLFGIIILLSLTKNISSSFALKFSVFGLIISAIIWLVNEQIIHGAEKITHSGDYVPDTDDSKIHEILGYKLIAMWVYLVFMIIIFLLSLLF